MADPRTDKPLLSTDCPRRAVLRGAAGLLLAWMTPVRAFGQDAGPPPAAGDWLVRVDDTALIPLTPDDVPFDGNGMMVWALAPKGDVVKNGGSIHRILLARLDPSTMSVATRERAADDIVAYSAICTHAGCEVDESLGGNQTLYCSCHGSTFDPRDSGLNIGGPAPRGLPALPLRLVEGRLVIAGPFTSPPGFG